ncbi:hypothetical protein ACFO34_004816 [Salmonella enterica]|uniref:hypothetical protein n=1 Tax=Salmonella enterica TaxID=28901 RepID=UPI00069B9CBA|nr:hypothetical protein [Salmonella enterica]EHJ6431839.1 hypothetical protein [Salmonella enterica subsp. enterica serovar Newport]EKX9354777.1 hypothetical protein [Pseudomonas aeruginosa]KNM36456.1 hypothetical protein AEU92_04035 [Salmonella enterica subsp. enterica serovar Berta]
MSNAQIIVRFGWRVVASTLFLFALMMLAGLMTCDPDVATFRDLVLDTRNPALWTLPAFGGFGYASHRLIKDIAR